jgi:Ca2+/Na+ antiporter
VYAHTSFCGIALCFVPYCSYALLTCRFLHIPHFSACVLFLFLFFGFVFFFFLLLFLFFGFVFFFLLFLLLLLLLCCYFFVAHAAKPGRPQGVERRGRRSTYSHSPPSQAECEHCTERLLLRQCREFLSGGEPGIFFAPLYTP